jgi:hypothetical protein
MGAQDNHQATGSRGFDADLVVLVQAVNGWTPKDYVLDLRRIFNASGTYKDKLSLGNRCATLEYAGDFSLDVVPCIVGRPPVPGRFEVCNRAEDELGRVRMPKADLPLLVYDQRPETGFVARLRIS